MKTKRIAAVALSATLAISVAACSSGKTGTTDTGKDAGASTDPKNKKITVSLISGTWENPVPGPDSEAVKKINEKFNIDFKPQYVPWDTYDEKLTVVMASGDIPDIIGMEQTHTDPNFTKWAKQGAFLPLDEFLNQYESFKAFPKEVWNLMKVEGKTYAIPHYFSPKGGKRPVIRKDWLDKLGLKMPTNYDELKQVAIAFAKNDPDGNGKADTIGLGLAKGIYYGANFGSYWSAWTQKNESGQLIPDITPGAKEVVQFLTDLHKEGALKKDWPVTNYNDVFKEFNAGKVGIWFEQPGAGGIDFKTLIENDPKAEVVPLPIFKSPDGSQTISVGTGYYMDYLINAKLKNDPEKVKRILGMIDYFRKWIPADQQNPQNEYYDWLNGGENKGYKMVNGVPQKNTETRSSVAPNAYIIAAGWAPNDEDLDLFIKNSKNPAEKAFNTAIVDYLKKTPGKLNPVTIVQSDSPAYTKKSTELGDFLKDEKTKMIVGQKPISDWDKMVSDYMAKGGKDVIDEVNKLIKDRGLQ
ncbi:extracellular solute-binding protein [Paenibacillus sp. MBLB4367]|uniref:extracellular solute-binding protein n=1 Tax=Paenibacillus sp. MBLB4367 TaxID=3384767 RepID=UPI00390817E4